MGRPTDMHLKRVNWSRYHRPPQFAASGLYASTIPDPLAARFLFGCGLDHRAMGSSNSKLPARTPNSGGKDVSSFGSSGAEYFDGMAQECIRWLTGWIGPGLVADPGSVTTDKIIGAA